MSDLNEHMFVTVGDDHYGPETGEERPVLDAPFRDLRLNALRETDTPRVAIHDVDIFDGTDAR